MISRRAASEFPNDNPELHDGLVWACPETSGRALPTLRVRPLAGPLPRVLGPAWEADEPDAPPAELVVLSRRPVVKAAEPLEPLMLEPFTLEASPECALEHAGEVERESAPEHEAEPACDVESEAPVAESPPDGPFERFIAALSRVAMTHGATRAGAAVSLLLTEGRLASHGVDPSLLESLARRRILAPGSVQVSAEFAAATLAWRAVLEGTAGDLSACGSATLDAWAADLLAAVMAAPQEAAELRRELRRTGVAAFGLLAVA